MPVMVMMVVVLVRRFLFCGGRGGMLAAMLGFVQSRSADSGQQIAGHCREDHYFEAASSHRRIVERVCEMDVNSFLQFDCISSSVEFGIHAIFNWRSGQSYRRIGTIHAKFDAYRKLTD